MDANKANLDPNRQFAAGPGTTDPKDLLNRGSEMYDQTKQTVTEAYDRTARTLTDGYEQAMTYGRENPGKMTMIAFGVGFGLGLMMAGRRSRTGRYAEPVINALSDVALEFVRNR
jgi:ElaB/YqjD/DUF883 family membrane-anchored ribosome-binding protein